MVGAEPASDIPAANPDSAVSGPVVAWRQVLGKLKNLVEIITSLSRKPLQRTMPGEMWGYLPIPFQKCSHRAAQVEANLCDEGMDVTAREGASSLTARESH